jgi:hypothetical protein
MRIWLTFFLAALVCGNVAREARAQRGAVSKAGTVAARPTGIEVSNPITNRKLPAPADDKIAAFAEALLKRSDSNGNGELDGDEIKKVSHGEEYDINKDAVVTLDEIVAGLQKRIAGEQPVAAVVADKTPRKLIAFEFVVIERTGAELAEEKDKVPTVAQLLKLEKDGKAGSVQRLKLTALENVEARLQLGEEAPFISSRASGGGRGGFAGGAGPVQESVTYNSLGTTITLTAETETDGKVLASINLARSTVAAPAKAPDKADGQETGVSTNYPRRLQSTVVSTVRITPGETAIVAGQQTHTGGSPGELWVLVTAKIE